MRPEFIDRMSWEMAEVYGAVTDQILINLAHYFPYYNAKNFPRSSITYQADMLAQMGQVNKETMRIIRRNLVGADRHLKAALEQVIIDSVQEANPELVQAVKRGIFNPPQVPVVAPNQYKAFNLYYKQAADKLNLVNTVMLESTQQAYAATVADIAARIKATQTALDIGAGETITGVSAWNKATAHAISRLKRDGITGFIDHGGHRWSAEAYVAMDIRTTMANTGRAAVWETNQNFGNDLYQVSYHNGARPLCYPWQSKVISSTDDARTVTDLDGNEIQVYAQSQTSYGEPAGLFGINCKHYPTPFIPGVSLIRAGGQSEEENAKTYEESQQQRGLERKIREEKRDLLMLKEQGAPDDLIKAQRAKIRQTDDDIDAFCKETGRARRQNREAVYTKREFPAVETYDVTEFERKQKEMIDSFYSNNGAQQNYTFGQMTPKVEPQPIKRTPQTVQDANTRPENEPEFLKQFKRYDTATKTDAEKLAQINPNYYDVGTLEWTYNCQRCVAAQELVYRGYDVTALPYNRRDAIKDSGVAVWDIRKDFWKDPELAVVPTRKEFEETLSNAFAAWGEGSRGVVRVEWTKSRGGNGHFLFARYVNGEVIYTDPQKNTIVDIKEELKKTTTGTNHMWVMRVDNRAVNDKITLAVKNTGE